MSRLAHGAAVVTAPASLAWACSERPLLYGAGASAVYGITPCLVAVALTAEAAEAWRDEPAEGVRREVGPIPLLDPPPDLIALLEPHLREPLRRLLSVRPVTPPTRIEGCP